MDLSNLDSLPAALRSAATFQNLVAGQVLFHEREPAQAIFAVAVGRFRLVRYTSEGQLLTSPWAEAAGILNCCYREGFSRSLPLFSFGFPEFNPGRQGQHCPTDLS